MARIREEYPRELWPTTRTYTVRSWDPVTRELAIDFVVHGDEGLAGPWALRAAPGDQVTFLGPGGGYGPDASADWHLLAGDESALPAIAAALEQMPAGAVVHAFVEVADAVRGAEDRRRPTGWSSPGCTAVTVRSARPLTAAVKSLDFPAGEVQAFVHGEAGFVKEIRRHLRLDAEDPAVAAVDLRLLAPRPERRRLALGEARVERAGGARAGARGVSHRIRPPPVGTYAPVTVQDGRRPGRTRVTGSTHPDRLRDAPLS